MKISSTRFFLSILILTIVSCTYVQSVRDGETAFERKQYAVAVDMYGKEYKKTKSRVEKGKIAFKIGESYNRMNKSENAIDWYLIAYDNQYGTDALKEYAYSLKKSQRYKEAKDAFKNLGIEIGSPYEYRREITACQQAIDWLKGLPQSPYSIELAAFNSTDADYSPALYEDGQLLITSDRSASLGEEVYNWTGNNFSDIFLVNPKSNTVSTFDNGINTPNNEGTIAFNEDFTEMYFTRCYTEGKNTDDYCKILISRKEGDSWTSPTILPFVEEGVNYGHPCLSPDGGLLYFSANHPDGWGGFDLYISERTPDGWDIPQLLSRSINTIGNEKFPFLDGDTLYFASDYHTGMGGLDIFRSYKMDNGNWSPIHNLKPPINSGGDDFGFIIDRKSPLEKDVLQLGYYSSTRSQGMGNDDIYRFERRLPPPPPPIDSTIEPEPIVYEMILETYVLEKIYQFPDNPNSKVLGRKPLDASKIDIQIGEERKTVTVGEDGLYRLELSEDTDYNFFASHPGYLNNSERFSTKGIGKDPNNPKLKFEVEIVLDKIFKDKEITLDNIYYDYDKWDIRNDAQPTLNALARTLSQNPDIKIQLSSHTDCRGRANYNETLSQRRAQSAVDYLITRGISPERVVAKGYGKNALAIDCACARCTEEEHQANRRTTFKVLE